VTVVAETKVVGSDAPLHVAFAPLIKGALALAVSVMVSLPTGSGLGEIAVMVGPAASGFT
jgi:hypothetical protein